MFVFFYDKLERFDILTAGIQTHAAKTLNEILVPRFFWLKVDPFVRTIFNAVLQEPVSLKTHTISHPILAMACNTQWKCIEVMSFLLLAGLPASPHKNIGLNIGLTTLTYMADIGLEN